MKLRFKNLSLLLALVMVLSLFTPLAVMAAEGTSKTVTILATSDMHGRIFPYEYAIDAYDDDAGFALIQTLIKQEKQAAPNAILLDNGDTLQDNMAELFNNDPVHPMMQALNYMGYDAWTLGNHEFNFGLDFLGRNINAFEGAALSANTYKEDGTRFVNGYTIIERDGIRTAVVGITPPHIPRWEAANPDNFKGLNFTDPVEEAKKVVKELEGKYDVLIGLVHMGDTAEYDLTDGSLAIAEACPEFDAIICGHKHSLFDNIVSKSGVKLIEPGKWGQALAKVEVKVEKSGNGWDVKEVTTKNISTKGVTPDKELSEKFQFAHDTSLAEANKVIGEVTADFIDEVDFITGDAKVTTMPTSQLMDNAVIDFINEVQEFYTGAEISTAALFKNDSNLIAGPFKKKDVAFIYMYDNTLMGVNITGKNLKAYMEWSASYYNTYNEGDLTVSFDQDIRGYNYDMLSGVEYKIDITKPVGSRIVDLTLNGSPIQDDKVYKMAVNNYRFGTLITNGWAKNEDKYFDSYAEYGDGGRVRDLIIKYVQEEKDGEVAPTVDNNWSIVGMDINHPHLKAVKILVEAGLLKIPTSEDGRTPNVKSLNLNELVEAGLLSDAYVAEKGDVIWNIAKKFNLKWKELAEYNNMVYPYLTPAGTKIYIPVKAINVISTNDFHGAIEGGSEGGAAKLAAYIDYYKSKNPSRTLVFDAGDAFQGTPVSNVHRGKPVVEMMAAIGYDAMTVGNHEFDWGIEEILKSLKLYSKMPLLVANIYEDGKPVDWAKPYTIIEKDGIKIGIIGLATPETAITAHADFVGGYEFKNPVEIANALIPEVKAAGAQVVVILGHTPGFQDSKTMEITGELADVANGVTGADVIIGGHSHKNVYGLINNAAIMENNYNGRNISYATVVFDCKTGKVVARNAKNIEVRNGTLAIEPVAEVQAIVDKYNEELKPVFGEVIGTTAEALVRDYNNESTIGNWVTDVMRAKSGVQIAMTNAGGLRADIQSGEMTIGDIFTVMPFDNTLVVGEMTGAQIKATMEQSVTLYKGMMQISGMSFTYDSTKPEGERVISMTLADGTPIEMDETYTVCTNDFLSGGQDGFVTLKETTWTNTYELIRDAMIEDVRANEGVNTKVEGRAVDVSKQVSFIGARLAA